MIDINALHPWPDGIHPSNPRAKPVPNDCHDVRFQGGIGSGGGPASTWKDDELAAGVSYDFLKPPPAKPSVIPSHADRLERIRQEAEPLTEFDEYDYRQYVKGCQMTNVPAQTLAELNRRIEAHNERLSRALWLALESLTK